MVLNRIGAKFGIRLDAGSFRNALFPQSVVNRIRSPRVTIDNVFDDPQILLGKTPEQVKDLIREAEEQGWKSGFLGQGSLKNQGGLRLTELTEEGNATDKSIRWNPFGRHHENQPYWTVANSQGGKIRVGPQFIKLYPDYYRWGLKLPLPILHLEQTDEER